MAHADYPLGSPKSALPVLRISVHTSAQSCSSCVACRRQNLTVETQSPPSSTSLPVHRSTLIQGLPYRIARKSSSGTCAPHGQASLGVCMMHYAVCGKVCCIMQHTLPHTLLNAPWLPRICTCIAPCRSPKQTVFASTLYAKNAIGQNAGTHCPADRSSPGDHPVT